MPWTDIVILCGILAVFSLFGLVLAYGQYQTRDIDRGRDESAAAAEPPAQEEHRHAA
jgi:hypothetical protein